MRTKIVIILFFFNDTATTEIYTLSLHDALPISFGVKYRGHCPQGNRAARRAAKISDRKSTRLNSSHLVISYAVFCLKKKKKHTTPFITFKTIVYINTSISTKLTTILNTEARYTP